MTLIHGAGVACPGPKSVTYSRPPACESSKSVEEFQILRHGSGRHGVETRAALRSPRGGRGGCSQTIELIGQIAALPDQNDTCNRRKPRARLLRDQIRAQQKYRTAGVVGTGLRLRLTHSKLCLEGDLQVLEIGSCSFVQDYEIDGKPLHPPVLVSAQQLPRDGDVVDIVNS